MYLPNFQGKSLMLVTNVTSEVQPKVHSLVIRSVCIQITRCTSVSTVVTSSKPTGNWHYTWEPTQKSVRTDVMYVGNPSQPAATWQDTRESIQGSVRTNVMYVGNPSHPAATWQHTREPTQPHSLRCGRLSELPWIQEQNWGQFGLPRKTKATLPEPHPRSVFNERMNKPT